MVRLVSNWVCQHSGNCFLIICDYHCEHQKIFDNTKTGFTIIMHSTAQHSTAQHSTAQHSTAQHSTAQHSTAQHSTAKLLCQLCQKFFTTNCFGADCFLFSPKFSFPLIFSVARNISFRQFFAMPRAKCGRFFECLITFFPLAHFPIIFL